MHGRSFIPIHTAVKPKLAYNARLTCMYNMQTPQPVHACAAHHWNWLPLFAFAQNTPTVAPQSPLELPQLRSCVSLKRLMLLVLLLVTAFVCSVAFAILQGALLASLCAWLKKHCAAHTNRVAAGLHASSSVCGRVFQPTECASVGVRECQAAKLCCSSTCQLCS